MRFSARASKFGVLLFVSTLAIGSYFLTRNLRLVWLAHAQTTAPGFTARMVSHANYGTQQQSFIEEKSITVTADGATVESYSLPGRPLSQFAVTVTSRDGHRTVSVGHRWA